VPLAPVRDLKVGLLSALRPGREALAEAAAQDCRLVVLPELPFHRWFPALAEVDRHDQDPSCLEAQADLARASGLWLLGGNLEDRRNAAYLWDPQGQVRLRYEKLHLPHEPGFWEDHHYDPGSQPPRVFDGLGFPLGVQICSDIQRPFGSMFLRHQGASAILVPRATESSTYARWRLVMQAMARVTACYVLSVNRPGPELGVALGGPSLAVGPDGEVLAESQDPLLCVTLEHAAVVRARGQYPGYLAVAHEVYAAAWSESLHFGNP
jgi:N-carbamoylputrescine amidase